MFYHRMRYKESGTPILSKREINNIAEKLLWDYNPEYMKTPQEVDICSIIREYLGMKIEEKYLSSKKIFMGMTVFKDATIPVFNIVTRKAEYVDFKAGTVILEKTLANEENAHRYRYTAGHECGHGLLHMQYYDKHPEGSMACRMDGVDEAKSKTWDWNDYDWMEWQANAFSSAVLMPTPAVKKIVQEEKKKDYPWGLYSVSVLSTISKVFNVSKQAAAYRLKDLGCLAKDERIENGPLGVRIRRKMEAENDRKIPYCL